MTEASAVLPGLLQNSGRTLGGRVAQSEMRVANMGLILRQIQAQGGRSRAQLAADTGLSKATTSSLIADLVERELVREGALMREGTVGRPGTSVTLDGSTVSGIGLEIGIDFLALTAVTLNGSVLRESVVPVDVLHLGIEVVLDRIAMHLGTMVTSLRQSGVRVIGITVSPPGVIDYAKGTLRFAPNIGWYGVPIVAELEKRLGAGMPTIHLENDAKLAALAEFDRHAHLGVRDLIYLSGQVGIGAGIISEGRLVRGWLGASGEVGHMPLDPELTPCNCGRRGCWETVVGLNAFLHLAMRDSDDLLNPARPIDDRLFVLRMRADSGDPQVLSALKTIADRLSVGIGILVDVLNPRIVVLGGYYAHFEKHLLGPISQYLESRRMTEGRTELVTSRLGLLSTAKGGALLALEAVFDDPTIVPAVA